MYTEIVGYECMQMHFDPDMLRRLKMPIAVTAAFLALYFVAKAVQRWRGPGEVLVEAEELIHAANPAAIGPAVEQVAPKAKLGYFIALKFYEQQTQAMKNFLHMQCLANDYSMQIVEPFIAKSQLAFPFSTMLAQDQQLRLSDLVDMELWNGQTVDYGYPPVASWEEFLANAPRDVVIVCVRCRDPPRIRIPKPGSNFRLGCTDSCFDGFSSALSFLGAYRFQVVRKACANFEAYAGSVTSDDFLDNILGSKYRRENVTVILNEFRGFFGLYRMQILSHCGLITHSKKIQIMPSQRLVRESKQYSEMNFGKRPYVSILVRVEKIILHSLLNLTACAEEVVSVLERLERRLGLEERFLAMDVGRYGSSGSALHHLQPQGERFFGQVYGERWTFRDWEESFSQASSSSNPAYVANLQRTLAAMGQCLLMVGAGGFQAQARNLYDKYHQETNSRCVYKICAG